MKTFLLFVLMMTLINCSNDSNPGSNPGDDPACKCLPPDDPTKVVPQLPSPLGYSFEKVAVKKQFRGVTKNAIDGKLYWLSGGRYANSEGALFVSESLDGDKIRRIAIDGLEGKYFSDITSAPDGTLFAYGSQLHRPTSVGENRIEFIIKRSTDFGITWETVQEKSIGRLDYFNISDVKALSKDHYFIGGHDWDQNSHLFEVKNSKVISYPSRFDGRVKIVSTDDDIYIYIGHDDLMVAYDKNLEVKYTYLFDYRFLAGGELFGINSQIVEETEGVKAIKHELRIFKAKPGSPKESILLSTIPFESAKHYPDFSMWKDQHNNFYVSVFESQEWGEHRERFYMSVDQGETWQDLLLLELKHHHYRHQFIDNQLVLFTKYNLPAGYGPAYNHYIGNPTF